MLGLMQMSGSRVGSMQMWEMLAYGTGRTDCVDTGRTDCVDTGRTDCVDTGRTDCVDTGRTGHVLAACKHEEAWVNMEGVVSMFPRCG